MISFIKFASSQIVISVLLSLVNSRAGASALPTAQEFMSESRTGQQIAWIMDDGGAFLHFPRLYL